MSEGVTSVGSGASSLEDNLSSASKSGSVIVYGWRLIPAKVAAEEIAANASLVLKSQSPSSSSSRMRLGLATGSGFEAKQAIASVGRGFKLSDVVS